MPGEERIWADADIQMQVLQASSQASESTAAREDGTAPCLHLDVAGVKTGSFTKQVYSRIVICSSKVGKERTVLAKQMECRETGRGDAKKGWKGEASCAVKRALLLQESSQRGMNYEDKV